MDSSQLEVHRQCCELQAARHAFKQLHTKRLRALVAMLQAPIRSTSAATEMKLAEALVKHVLPGLTPQECEDILSKRDKHRETDTVWSSLLTEDNLEVLASTMDTEHARELREESRST